MSAPARRSRCATPRRGQSLVELALVMPLLALLLVGTTDLARAFFYHTRLTNAVKEGAIHGACVPWNQGRYEAGPGPLQTIGVKDVRDRAYAEAGGRLGTPGTDVIVDVECYEGASGSLLASPSCSNAGKGDIIQVRGQYTFRAITPSVRGLWDNTFTMRKSVRMVILSGI